MKERILSYLEKDARIAPADIATMLGITEKEVKDIIEECEENGTIMNYHTVIN
ncbi:MAG: Lrp/AsnC family transcriptional regulator, partial [Clostridia bacterium]|nr:Lrp/AsnC family transcriptional regulator [Clostridia bacterium]